MPFNAQAQKRNRKYIRQDPVRMALQQSRRRIIEGPLLKQLLHAGSNYGMWPSPANSHIERPRARYVRTVRAAKNTLPQMHVPNADDSRNEH